MSWIEVLLDQETSCFSDSNGGFVFGNVGLGQHTVSVNIEGLPAGLTPTSSVQVEITEEELDVWGLLVPLTFAQD